MSAEYDEYMVRLSRMEIPVPNNRDILIQYAYFMLLCKTHEIWTGLASLSVPCRSNLYRLLMGIVYNGVTTSQGDIDVSETEARHLAIIFKNQKDYSFWKEGLTIFQEQGRDKAWEWVREKIPVLQLRNELTPKTKYEE